MNEARSLGAEIERLLGAGFRACEAIWFFARRLRDLGTSSVILATQSSRTSVDILGLEYVGYERI